MNEGKKRYGPYFKTATWNSMFKGKMIVHPDGTRMWRYRDPRRLDVDFEERNYRHMSKEMDEENEKIAALQNRNRHAGKRTRRTRRKGTRRR